jgi:CheY-like chemotaxis protein
MADDRDWRSLLKRYMAFMLLREGTTHTVKLDDMVGFSSEEAQLLHDLGEEPNSRRSSSMEMDREGNLATLLVVDDDPDVLDALCSMLEPAHRVERASNGVAALNIIENGAPIDLLLTDAMMPGLHGFALACMARVRRPERRVLYISGKLETMSLNDTGAQFGPVLLKPIRIAELLRAVDEALA